MKLIKQTILVFQEGRSDKVYEVDLCDVGAGQFVVNFRYGRRGTALRDGSKTTSPVSRSEADSIFEKLVQSKMRKGYGPAGEQSSAEKTDDSATTRTAEASAESDARTRSILQRLEEGDGVRRDWPLDRAIWRAGELRTPGAEPILLRLLEASRPNQALRRYCLCFALGRCGTETAIPQLRTVYQDKAYGTAESPATRRIAGEALRLLLQGEDLEAFFAEVADQLPARLSRLAMHGPADEFAEALQQTVLPEHARGEELYPLYLIDNERTRASLLEICRTVPIRRDVYRQLVQIFKAAEYRRDGETFGILAYRFEKERSHTWNYWDAKEARFFGHASKNYLRRRAWRVLRRLGESNDPQFASMAAGVLLQFRDTDAQPRRSRGLPQGNTHWGPFARYWAFNQLLYHHSLNFYPDTNGRFFRSRIAEAAPSDRREEAFPELWDKAPEKLLQLIEQGGCEPVHHLAVHALRDNTAFLAQLKAAAVIRILNRPYPVTAAFGLHLAERIYDPQQPDTALLDALANCVLESARNQAHRWIDAASTRLTHNSELLARLALSKYPDTRRFASNLLTASRLDEKVVKTLVARLIAELQVMPVEDNERATDVASLLLRNLGDHLPTVSPKVIEDLLQGPTAAAQQLAGDIALLQMRAGQPIMNDVLIALLDAEHAEARAAGARLLTELNDDDLSQRSELLYNLSRHPREDLRAASRPLVVRVAKTHPDFAATMAGLCMTGLRYQAEDGVHQHLLTLLREDLHTALPATDKAEIFKLLRARYPHAQELGGSLLEQNLQPDELSVAEIVRLASHDILSVRQAAWSMSQRSVPRFRKTMLTTTGLLDASWQDSRNFAFDFFREHFGPDELTPKVLVSICDSVRPDVQAFGREQITKYFAEEHGHEYLGKLSEHPSEALQLFATNYLNRYAADRVERIKELVPYFVSVLSRVNKGGLAKQRCLRFLEVEGLKSREAASLVAAILTRQSVTMAIQNKATILVAMLRLQEAYPDLDLPITAIETENRGGERNAV